MKKTNGKLPSSNDTKLDAALHYAEQGWPVLPCYTIIDGKCSCGNDGCKSPGKHPIRDLVPHGLKDATDNRDTVRIWWTTVHDANIGIVTGATSGIVAIDEDPRNGGELGICQLQDNVCNLPPSLTQNTGSGGHHYIFRHPGGNIPCRAHIFDGVDVRGDGGYIIVGPSNHISKNQNT